MKHGISKSSLLYGLSAIAIWYAAPSVLLAQIEQGGDVATLPPMKTPSAAAINTADFAVEDAEEVVIDIPSAFHWARYQRGDVGGMRYFLFPDGTAKVMGGEDFRDALMEMDCEAGVSCDITGRDGTAFTVYAVGGAKPKLPATIDAASLARFLAKWVLAGTGKPPVIDVPVPVVRPPVVIEVAPETEPLVEEETEALAAAALEAEAIAQEEIAAALAAEADAPEPLCSELDPLMPDSCAQPTSDIKKSEPVVVAQVRDTPTLSFPREITAAAPQEVVEEDATDETLFERLDLSCSITGSASLSYTPSGSDTDGVGKPRVSFGCSSTLTENLSLRVSFLKYLVSGSKQDFDPDFTYAFTYRVNDEVSLGYSNYAGQFDDIVDALVSGNLRASYKLPTLTLPNDKSLACSTSLGLPDPTDASANLSCGYALTDKIRIGGTANFYAPNAQGTYDPDYSYTASYRPTKDWLISYSNYSNNRWPWNRGDAPGPGFKGGSVSVTYSLKF